MKPTCPSLVAFASATQFMSTYRFAECLNSVLNKCESSSSRYQPGEGPSRGLLCDCTTSPIIRFAALVSPSSSSSLSSLVSSSQIPYWVFTSIAIRNMAILRHDPSRALVSPVEERFIQMSSEGGCSVEISASKSSI